MRNAARSHRNATRRSNRSLNAPVRGPKSAGAKSPTSNSSATANASPVSSATYRSRVTRPSESPRKEMLRAHHSARNGRLFRNRRIAPTPPASGPVLAPSPVILLLGHTHVGTDTASRARLAVGPTLPAAPDQSKYAVRVTTYSARVGLAMPPGLRGDPCPSSPFSRSPLSGNLVNRGSPHVQT